jgi:hypothetical protein
MLATATSAGGYDLQSPATKEKATNECVLDSSRMLKNAVYAAIWA